MHNLQPSTAENVAVFIWDKLKGRLPRPELLYEVRVRETNKNCMFYRGCLSGGNGIVRGHGYAVSSDSD